MMNELRTFTYGTYIKFLRFLQTKYAIIPLSDARFTEPPYLILTHDVDLSLASALTMARIEHEMGITSTYFILFSSELYNIFDSSNNSRLRRISKLNHEVGLHYDLKAYRRHKELTVPLNLEAGVLEMQTGKSVSSISMHQPEVDKGSPFIDVAPFICAENPALYDLYVSDSYHAWDLTYLEELLSLKHDRVKLSLHPGLWNFVEKDRNTAISDVLKCVNVEHYSKYMVKMMDYWRRHPKVKAYELDS